MQADDILAGLNPEQIEAVTYNDGPLLIIAGAGTGKTSVITRKIAYLVRHLKVPSEQILALTFTQKAAYEMEGRVDELLPYGYSNTNIMTFHAFAERFLRSHAYQLGYSTNFKVLSDVGQIMLLKDNVFSLELKKFAPLSDPTRFLKDLTTHISRLKDELITPEMYVEYAESLLARADSDIEREYAEEQLELARAYRRYQELLRLNDRMDFGDLVFATIEALQNSPKLLAQARSSYRYILVDEFQDTNHAQNELLKILTLDVSLSASEGYTKRADSIERGGSPESLGASEGENALKGFSPPSVTVVGDDDQSIYRFRGASVDNMLDFEEDWVARDPRGVKRVILKTNYRSTQEILDMSYRVIQNNNPYRLEAKYQIDKKLIAAHASREATHGRPDVLSSKHPELLYFDTATDEAAKIAQAIQDKKGEASYADFAILLRSNGQAAQIMNALGQARIPYVFSGAEGLFRRGVIKNIVSFLSVLTNPTDNLAMFNLLTCEIVGVDFDQLSVLLHHVRSINVPLEQFLRDKKDDYLHKVTTETVEKIDRTLDLLTEIRTLSLNKSAGEIVYDFLSTSEYLKKLSTGDGAGQIESTEKLMAIAQFFDRITGFQDINLDVSVQKFMEYLRVLLDIGEEKADDASHDPDYDAVRILSIHKSKGLEFDYVFVAGLTDTRMPGRNMGEALPFPQELKLAREGYAKQANAAERGDSSESFGASAEKNALKGFSPLSSDSDEHVREERRLFYVAMTRAKKELYFTAARDYGGKKTSKLSRFVVEAIGEQFIKPEMVKPSPIERIQHFAKSHAVAQTLYSTQLKTKEGRLRLSRAEVDDYMTCPRKYKFIHITPIRLMSDPRVVFGRAIHKVIEEYYKAAKKQDSQPLSLQDCLQIYRENWSSEGFLSSEHEKMRFDEGAQVVTRFYRDYAGQFDPVEIEKPFAIDLEDVRVEGRIDMVDRMHDGSLRIIDFKTSDISDSAKADKRSAESIQLAVYALALEQMGQSVSHVGLFFLMNGILGSAAPKPELLEKTKESIMRAAAGIRSQQFIATPDQMKCSQCPYSIYCDDSAV